MSTLRAIVTLTRVTTHALRGYWTIRRRFPQLDAEAQALEVHRWAQRMLSLAGIELAVEGPRPQGPVLLVANHISWLDILVMHAAGYCRFVSKADVKHWPVVGTLASGGGTLFIERESRRDAHRVVHHMVERLQAGDVLAVFPEGTTGDGITLKPFHANLIQAAISSGKPVQPVALVFRDRTTGAMSHAPRYVDDDTLLGSVWRTLCAKGLSAEVVFGTPELAQGRDRRTWAADLRRQVDALRRVETAVETRELL
ncbi:MAG: lysophospholipid acyltransferase family protein [Pseudomonadota bacterium]